MGKIQENKQQKQERLLNTAFQLFTTKGLTKTSISDIVNNAGVGKGTFYLYFKDKYDLADRLIARKASHLCAQASERLNRSDAIIPQDRIIFLVDDILNELSRTHVLLRFINKNLSWGIFKNAMIRAEGQKEFDLNALMNQIFGDEIDHWRDLNTMLYLIIEMVGSCCYSVILDRDPMPLEELKPHLYRSIRAVVNSFRVEN